MSSRIEPSLHEVLNYPDESRRMLMQGFADKVDRIASNNRRHPHRTVPGTTYTPYHPNRKPQAIYKEEQLF